MCVAQQVVKFKSMLNSYKNLWVGLPDNNKLQMNNQEVIHH